LGFGFELILTQISLFFKGFYLFSPQKKIFCGIGQKRRQGFGQSAMLGHGY